MLDVLASAAATGEQTADAGTEEAANGTGQVGAGASLRFGHCHHLGVAVRTNGQDGELVELHQVDAGLVGLGLVRDVVRVEWRLLRHDVLLLATMLCNILSVWGGETIIF